MFWLESFAIVLFVPILTITQNRLLLLLLIFSIFAYVFMVVLLTHLKKVILRITARVKIIISCLFVIQYYT